MNKEKKVYQDQIEEFKQKVKEISNEMREREEDIIVLKEIKERQEQKIHEII